MFPFALRLQTLNATVPGTESVFRPGRAFNQFDLSASNLQTADR